MSKNQNDKQFPIDYKISIHKMQEGYYSGDKPNPNLRAFVETHLNEHPYDPETDDYDVPAFNKPIETTKATAIYNMHTYWSKKPHDAIRQYIQHYTKQEDLVLDPFCGSGGTALAALMDGRKAIAIDRSPAATFITKNYCTPVDINELMQAFEELKAKVKPEIEWLYETRCDRCDGKATTAYTVYSQVFQCPRCLEKIPLFDCVESEGKTAKGKPKKISVCPYCYEKGHVEEIKTSSEKFGSVPVLVSYLCENGCKQKKDERRHNDSNPKKREFFRKYDLGKISEIDSRDIPYWYPKNRMMNAPEDQVCWGVKWRAGTSNFRTVDELFTKRNLWALAAIKNSARSNPYKDVFYFGLSAVSLALSRMQRYSPTSGFPNMVLAGTYYTPQIGREIEVFSWFEGKINALLKGFKLLSSQIRNEVIISTSDARNKYLSDNSVDYIFTDPPYAEKIQYGELNFIWEAWLNLDTNWHDDEIIVNHVRGKTEVDWADMMKKAMFQCYKVLKPGRWISLCYHDTSEGTWSLIQDIMSEIGFIPDKSDSALFIDTSQKSFNQLTADKVTKRDLVINFQKPNVSELRPTELLTGAEDEKTFQEKVISIIVEYLSSNIEATKDRIYDEVVSRMVRKGRMEAFNFDEILNQIAEQIEAEGKSVGGVRWILKEKVDRVNDSETRLEDVVASRLENYMKNILLNNPEKEGVHYSDLFEYYLPLTNKPRRLLADWLWDYFYKTSEGTWRPPADEVERDEKRRQRASGTLRKIKSYAKLLDSGTPIPSRLQPDSDRTSADWIHQARRAGLYYQGKIIFEKSGLNLSHLEAHDENLAMDVNEDYQYCLSVLGKEKAGNQ